MSKPALLLLLLSTVILLSACSDAGYYVQCVGGHLDVMRRCRPIDDLLADQTLPAERRARLEQIREVREFASRSLALPDNGSYRSFADLERPYVVWNVVAAPELSLEARQWCFPVAGCVSYRGYFDESAARDEAQRLQEEGLDVDRYGVQAYSTLNWFDDPVLNTFTDGPELQAAALIFHELAHQVVYVADDSRFNEAFARTVEEEGVRRWLTEHGTPDEWQRYRQQAMRAEAFHELLLTVRRQLAELYAGSQAREDKLKKKQEILLQANEAYQALKLSWNGYAGYDPWISRGLNNARLAAVATYHDLVPAFAGLLAETGGSLPAFYAKVTELAALPSASRLARLERYAENDRVKKG